MSERNSKTSFSRDRQYLLKAFDQFAIGAIVFMWGSLLMLKQVGLLDKNLSSWPFVFIAFGGLLIVGSIHRLVSRNQNTIEK
jgi:hypothetical protein